jgi:hypothetical protein
VPFYERGQAKTYSGISLLITAQNVSLSTKRKKK